MKTVFYSQDELSFYQVQGDTYLYIYIYIMFGSFENLYFYLNRHHTAEQKQRGRQSCTCTLRHLRLCEWCHLQSFFINFFVLFFVLISQHLTTVARWWRQEKNNNICWPRNTSNSAKSGRAGHGVVIWPLGIKEKQTLVLVSIKAARPSYNLSV